MMQGNINSTRTDDHDARQRGARDPASTSSNNVDKLPSLFQADKEQAISRDSSRSIRADRLCKAVAIVPEATDTTHCLGPETSMHRKITSQPSLLVCSPLIFERLHIRRAHPNPKTHCLQSPLSLIGERSLELLESLGSGLVLGDSKDVESNSLGQWSALTWISVGIQPLIRWLTYQQ